MSEFGIHFKRVLDHCGDLQRYTTEIDNFTNTLEASSEKALMSWDGAAKAQYRIEKKNWNAAIERMRTNLAGTGIALGNIHDNSFRTEVKNAGLFNNTQY